MGGWVGLEIINSADFVSHKILHHYHFQPFKSRAHDSITRYVRQLIRLYFFAVMGATASAQMQFIQLTFSSSQVFDVRIGSRPDIFLFVMSLVIYSAVESASGHHFVALEVRFVKLQVTYELVSMIVNWSERKQGSGPRALRRSISATISTRFRRAS